jgi:protein TonB
MRITLFISILSLLTIGHVTAQQDSTMTEEIWDSVEPVDRAPSFPGGQEAMYKFVYSEVRYPADAKRFGISGSVITQFTVAANGDMEDLKVVKGLGYGCDEEALRVMTMMQEKYAWNSGLHKGKPVPVTFSLPIQFGPR